MHYSDYLELTPAIKAFLLEKDFTKGRYSANADEVAVYLYDVHIARKAIKVPTKHFKTIVKKYDNFSKQRAKAKMDDNSKFKDDRRYIDVAMKYAAELCAYELLVDAIRLNTSPPQDTDVIKSRNNAIDELNRTTIRLDPNSKTSKEKKLMTFEKFLQINKEITEFRFEILGYGDISNDRFKRIYTNISKEASKAYQILWDKFPHATLEDKIAAILKGRKHITEELNLRAEWNEYYIKQRQDDMSWIAFLWKKHNEYHSSK